MPDVPVLESARLRLRPPRQSDAPRIVPLADEREVAANTLTMPHPYSEVDAREWIERCRRNAATGEEIAFVVETRDTAELVGACGIGINQTHRLGEVGYFIGRPYWNRGYCSEAVRTMLDWGVTALAIDKLIARVFTGNAGSSAVVRKLGMEQEGLLRRHLVKWGERRDVEQWGMLVSEYQEKGRLQ